ncbi:calcitonin [Brachionus plicatilis]|uniref:Calcitonin n=1 Tax=Brachionus plicatilis TaxID=10195 RepID=A0A3M7RHE8_BRAPC|nr:calcitonin [Brachionus plicatilis]
MLGQCRLSRFGSFSPKVFNRLSCANCYNLLVYVSPDTKLQFNVTYEGYLVSDDLGFDPTDPNDILGIKSSMQLSEFDRWRACCVSAERCCSKVMVKSPTNSSGHCTSIWDGWSCHKRTLAGQISKVKCPYYVLGDTCNTVFDY